MKRNVIFYIVLAAVVAFLLAALYRYDHGIDPIKVGFVIFVAASVVLYEKVPLKIIGPIYGILFVCFIAYFFMSDTPRNDLESNLAAFKPVAGQSVSECTVGQTGQDTCGAVCKCIPGDVPTWLCDKNPCSKIVGSN